MDTKLFAPMDAWTQARLGSLIFFVDETREEAAQSMGIVAKTTKSGGRTEPALWRFYQAGDGYFEKRYPSAPMIALASQWYIDVAHDDFVVSTMGEPRLLTIMPQGLFTPLGREGWINWTDYTMQEKYPPFHQYEVGVDTFSIKARPDPERPELDVELFKVSKPSLRT